MIKGGREQRIHTEFGWRNLMGNGFLEDQEGDGRITLRCILIK
jgi:hypothetical protein